MAEEQDARTPGTPGWQQASWTKIFTAFKVALDPKKLLLAGAGILAMWVGWWLLSVAFYAIRSEPHKQDYLGAIKDEDKEAREEAFKNFRNARQSWNFFYQLAGPVALDQDAADVAENYEEFRAIDEYLNQYKARAEKVKIHLKAGEEALQIGDKKYSFKPDKDSQNLEKLDATLGQVKIRDGLVTVAGVVIPGTDAKEILWLQKQLSQAKTAEEIRAEADADPNPIKKAAGKKAYDLITNPQKKPYGYLRTWPGHEDRGPNPVLLVTGQTKGPDEGSLPWERGRFFTWLLNDQVPVLVEPLVKLLSPIRYMLEGQATFGTRVYLLFGLLWNLLVWGLIGGAITRMAVVQVARPNEKVGMMEAVGFARARLQSYFSAPLFPIIFIAVLTVFLIIFGFIEGFTFFFGDIFLSVLFWPLILLMGLIMAVVLVGLVGWPLMYSTISAEGSDSFDALSRSYSYVFQAPWHYLWYSAVAVLYGAVLVFFVGFMGSLMVYMGKWGVSQTPFLQSQKPQNDRDPTYLFLYSPTSFGWRDLFLQSSQFHDTREVVRQSGRVAREITMKQEYLNAVSFPNRIGAFFVSIWLYLLFFLVLGFGYSYFWTASSIIYLLMRQKVDDTELDEIHLEEDEEEPLLPEAPLPSGQAPGGQTPAGQAAPAPTGLTMVESPTLKPTTDAAPHTDAPASPAASESPASERPKPDRATE